MRAHKPGGSEIDETKSGKMKDPSAN